MARACWTAANNIVMDLLKNQGMPAQVNKTAFEVGKNLGTSKGAVVFRNEVLELIQYAPTTQQVHSRPQLIVPPQINKFYIFDLSEGKSIVDYLVKNELQVFVVSWRNPTAAQSHWDLDTYVTALMEAIAAVREITGCDDVNLHGACSGAMTISALLGHLASKGDKTVNATTLMVAVLDNTADSQLGLFATPEAIAAAKQHSISRGVLAGEEMGRVFAWMRPNDLVWNYWVNNYLLGNAPPAFDVLYWNNDTTRLPAKMHGQLLDIFTQNLFSKPGALTVLGTPIDLSEVKCDKYVVAGMTDHITPWKGVYNTATTFGGDTRFVLSSSGHIQSLINPPGNPKSKYYLNPKLPANAEAWLDGAKAEADTWWGNWRDWLVGPVRRKAGSAGGPWQQTAPGRCESTRHLCFGSLTGFDCRIAKAIFFNYFNGVIMTATNPSNIFGEYTKLITQFKLPGVDVAAILESRRKDIEALAEANMTALAGVQQLGQKQVDIARSTMTELQSLVTRLRSPGSESAVATGEGVQKALQKAFVDMQELADAAYRAQTDSIAVVTKRFAEHVEELKALVQPKK